MMKKLETITKEELELERIVLINPCRVYCEFKIDCEKSGEYRRCYLDTSVLCPYYKELYQKRKNENNKSADN